MIYEDIFYICFYYYNYLNISELDFIVLVCGKVKINNI